MSDLEALFVSLNNRQIAMKNQLGASQTGSPAQLLTSSTKLDDLQDVFPETSQLDLDEALSEGTDGPSPDFRRDTENAMSKSGLSPVRRLKIPMVPNLK